ncbi:hypothetical protein ID866_2731 [Astraeus odoratus]|nr:hypothetical protein ID866_2731 [Astraeus odoratus]
MSDIRALLKARRHELQVSHPLAAYSSSGQLQCTLCAINVKHAAAWEGHLGSKMHRMNMVRLREQERLEEQGKVQEVEVEKNEVKRKAGEEAIAADGPSKKRQKPDVRSATESNAGSSSLRHLPADFFSDPSQAPPTLSSGESDDDEPEPRGSLGRNIPSASADAVLDEEWNRFQQTVINAPDQRETYDHATITAEPQLVPDVAAGFPAQLQDGQPHTQQDPGDSKADEEKERRHKEQEERELIMDRLVEEERAQEEADMRVSVMKNRLEAIRRKRETVRSAKMKPTSP